MGWNCTEWSAADLAAMLLVTISPSDRALAGWNVGAARLPDLAHRLPDLLVQPRMGDNGPDDPAVAGEQGDG